jgi:hypothetical protein
MQELAERFARDIGPGRLRAFAHGLGVTVESLRRLGVGWCRERLAWAFPMADDGGRVLGVRLRAASGGGKFAVTGGHEGLFLPTGLDPNGVSLLAIAEGASDCAALLDLGFQAVGRSNATGGAALLARLIRRLGPAEVAIIADRDPERDGEKGALVLARRLVPYAPRVRVVMPPEGIKDARVWVRAGATYQEILAAIRRADVHRIVVVREESCRGR